MDLLKGLGVRAFGIDAAYRSERGYFQPRGGPWSLGRSEMTFNKMIVTVHRGLFYWPQHVTCC